MKELNDESLSTIINQWVNPTSGFEFVDIKLILEGVKNIIWLTQEEIDEIIKNFQEIIIINNPQNFNRNILKEPKKWEKYKKIRNECQTNIITNLFTKSHNKFSLYIYNFYNKYISISYGDEFTEIEEALKQLEYVKHFKVRDLLFRNNVSDFNFHKNCKEIIYIYSCFDKISSIFHFFKAKKDKNKKVSFIRDMKMSKRSFYIGNEKLLKKTENFMKTKLFNYFKEIRNSKTHNFTVPYKDGYFMNFYTYLGAYLLIYYIDEILIKYFESSSKIQ